MDNDDDDDDDNVDDAANGQIICLAWHKREIFCFEFDGALSWVKTQG